VLDGGNAVMVGPLSEQMGAAIVRLLKNPEEARRLGAAAKAYSDANLSWKAFAELVSSVYEHAGDATTADT
jgi:glycosyltransferase involved in cell wall biosynthesis